MLMNGIILIVTTKNILMDNTFSTLSIEFDTDLELIDIRFRTGLKYIFCYSTKAISKDKLYIWLNKLCLVFQQKLLMKGDWSDAGEPISENLQESIDSDYHYREDMNGYIEEGKYFII